MGALRAMASDSGTLVRDAGAVVQSIVLDVLRRRAGGESLPDEAVIASNPELAGLLRAELARLRQICAAGDGFEDVGALDVSTADMRTAGTPGTFQVRCPHCREFFEASKDTPVGEIICSVCGGQFSVADSTADTRRAPALESLAHFDLIEVLGVGGFGTVWKARDRKLDRTVAIKIPHRGRLNNDELEKFLREARAAAQLQHLNIIRVYEVGREGDVAYIVSDFVRGIPLSDWLTGQQPAMRQAAEICATLADALQHAHERGVIHRDLKPANILIDGDGQPHLMDFGLARREVGEITVTLDGQVLGTPAYMSPEQARGEAHTADGRSDVYSLGVIFFELLTGELPFRGNPRMLMHQVNHDPAPSPRKFNGSIRKDLETITLKCLEKEPSRRYQSAEEFAEELRRFLAGEPVRARPVGRTERVGRWARRNPRVAGLTAAIVVLLVAVAGTSLAGYAVAKKQQLAAQQSAEREAGLRVLAERNLKLAQDAVDKHLTGVAEDERLKQFDFHELRVELLESAVPFYEQFANQTPVDAQGDVDRANAYYRLATIHEQTGAQQRSASEYERAIAIQGELVSKYPDVDEYRSDLAEYHAAYGWNLFLVFRPEFAIPHCDRALTLLGQIVQASNDPKYRHRLAQTRLRYGVLLRGKRYELARDQFRQAVAVATRLTNEFPDVPEYRSVLSSCQMHLGFSLIRYIKQIEPEVAKDYLTKAVAIQRKLCEEFPSNPEYRSALSESEGFLGAVFATVGEYDTASQQYAQGIDIQKAIVAEFPSVVKYQEGLASLYNFHGQWLEKANKQKAALEHYEQFAAVYDRLATDFLVSDYADRAQQGHYACVRLLEKLGDSHAARKHLEKALNVLEHTLSMYRELLKRTTEEPYHFVWVARLSDWSSRLAAQLDDHAAARKYREQELATYESIISRFTDEKKFGISLAVALDALAWKLATSGADDVRDGKRAVVLATRACELSEFTSPQKVLTLAAAYAEAGDFDAAVKWSKKSIEALTESSSAQLRDRLSGALEHFQARKPLRNWSNTH
jgi:tetratricopeptide (TPR) repeat protein/tRNA A-37 threonylcarbamoyl transferase component Bud32